MHVDQGPFLLLRDSDVVPLRQNRLRRDAVHTDAIGTCLRGHDSRKNLNSRFRGGIRNRGLRIWSPRGGRRDRDDVPRFPPFHAWQEGFYGEKRRREVSVNRRMPALLGNLDRKSV